MSMDTESIVKNIMQLKKMSDKLKQSTQNPNLTNTDLKRNLQKVCKQIHQIQYGTKIQRSNLNILINTEKKVKNSDIKHSEVNHSFQNICRSNTYLNNGVYGVDESAFGNQNVFFTERGGQQSLMTPSQQMIQLKNENQDLEEQIKNLQEKLRKLESIEKQQMDEQWKDGLPYFMLHIPKVLLFYTKLTISEKDYDKIDYKPYAINLDLQKVIISQISQLNKAKTHKQNTFMLCNLKEVNYPTSQQNNKVLPFALTTRVKEEESQYLIIYHFKQNKESHMMSKAKKKPKIPFYNWQQSQDKIKQNEQYEIIETLFIKFANEQQYKQWDLGLFINYKIVQDMTNNNNFKIQQLTSRVNLTKQQKSNDISKSSLNDLLQKCGDKNYLMETLSTKQINNLNNRSDTDIVTIQKNEMDENKEEDKGMQIKMKKIKSNDETQSIFELPKKRADEKFESKIKIRDEIYSPMKESKKSINEEMTKARSYTSHFGSVLEINNSEDNYKKLFKEQKEMEDNKRLKHLELEEQKRKEEERMDAMKKTENQLAIKRAKQSLKKGYLMTKYAKKGNKPHQRKIYLSDDGKKLQWSDTKDPSQLKFILIKEITSIKQGQIGKQIQAHLDPIKIDNKGCFVTIFLNSKNRKTLELSTRDQKDMEEFCKNLQLYKLNFT